MLGSTIRLSHLTPRASRTFRWHPHSRFREDWLEKGVQAHQDYDDFEADSALCILGHLVLFLQVGRQATHHRETC
jgi:hypothetical protein